VASPLRSGGVVALDGIRRAPSVEIKAHPFVCRAIAPRSSNNSSAKAAMRFALGKARYG